MKKDIMDMLNEPDEAVMEKLAESSPLPDRKMKKRIVEKCMAKTAVTAEGDSDGGTEVIRRPRWTSFAAAAAAVAIIAAGGAGVVMLGKNMKNTAPMTVDSGSDVITAPASASIGEPSTAPATQNLGVEEHTESRPTVTAYVAGANENSTVRTEAVDTEDVTEAEKAPADPDDLDLDKAEVVYAHKEPEETSKAPVENSAPVEQEQQTTAPADNKSETDEGNDKQIHYPNTPYSDPGPSAYCIGTFYWNSTGSLGNISWSFSAGANGGQQGSSGGVGQCTKDGYYLDTFNYSTQGSRITITMQSDYQTYSGTMSGALYNSAASFDIVWDNGGTDHFTYNFSESISD